MIMRLCKNKDKKILDILSEIDGKPVYPPVKKEKHLDLTDEIKLFLDKEVSYESIMNILLRSESSYLAKRTPQKNKIHIIKVCEDGYFIAITSKSYTFKYYIDRYCLMKIEYHYFGRSKDFMTSKLKKCLQNKIWEWLVLQNLPFSMD